MDFFCNKCKKKIFFL